MKTEPNERAFPLIDESPGLTKLEYFSAMAMQGLIANAPNGNLHNSREGTQLAVTWALDLIDELNKQQP